MDEQYPEGLYQEITINLSLDDSGVYCIQCPQWKFESHSTNPAHIVLELVREITQHNRECIEKDFSCETCGARTEESTVVCEACRQFDDIEKVHNETT